MPRILQSAPVGYQWLVDRYGLHCLPHDIVSRVGGISGTRVQPDSQTGEGEAATLKLFPRSFMRGDQFQDHLEFAFKYEGVNPGILKALFKAVGANAIADYIRSTPTGRYARRAWFFYEWLLGEQLDIPDLKTASAIPAVDPEDYYTAPPIASPRHRVVNNIAGVPGYCPMFRRSEYVDTIMRKDLPKQLMEELARHSPAILERAVNYLYAKESRTSFLIERETPAADKAARFITLLREAGGDAPLTDAAVIEIQKAILDEKRLDYGYGYRPVQGYVGEAKLNKKVIHVVGAKPEDLENLMHDLFAYMERLHGSDVPAIVQAAATAFGFVFIHPLEDGNGRAHRYLIHHVLERERYTPKNMIFPVSASILKDQIAYDTCLETFSKPLMRRIEYKMTDKGEMTVTTKDTADYYRYFNGTPIADFLAKMIEKTAEQEVLQEVTFLEVYDRVKAEVREKLPKIADKDLDLAIRLCHQNNGMVSKTKSDGTLSHLSQAEISTIQQSYARHVGASIATGMVLPEPEI